MYEQFLSVFGLWRYGGPSRRLWVDQTDNSRKKKVQYRTICRMLEHPKYQLMEALNSAGSSSSNVGKPLS
jgi:hypothetical protein